MPSNGYVPPVVAAAAAKKGILRQKADDDKEEMDWKAYENPEANVGIAFMRAGKVPPVGELSSGPSANIERRGPGEPGNQTPTPELPLEERMANRKSQLAKDLGIESLPTGAAEKAEEAGPKIEQMLKEQEETTKRWAKEKAEMNARLKAHGMAPIP